MQRLLLIWVMRKLKNFEEHGRGSQQHLRKYLKHYKYPVDKIMDFKGTYGEDLEANEEYVVKNGRKGDGFHIVADT